LEEIAQTTEKQSANKISFATTNTTAIPTPTAHNAAILIKAIAALRVLSANHHASTILSFASHAAPKISAMIAPKKAIALVVRAIVRALIAVAPRLFALNAAIQAKTIAQAVFRVGYLGVCIGIFAIAPKSVGSVRSATKTAMRLVQAAFASPLNKARSTASVVRSAMHKSPAQRAGSAQRIAKFASPIQATDRSATHANKPRIASLETVSQMPQGSAFALKAANKTPNAPRITPAKPSGMADFVCLKPHNRAKSAILVQTAQAIVLATSASPTLSKAALFAHSLAAMEPPAPLLSNAIPSHPRPDFVPPKITKPLKKYFHFS